MTATSVSSWGSSAFWLGDWVRYWWVRVPPAASELRLPHHTLPALWHADLWGEPLDRGLAVLLFGAAAIETSSRRSNVHCRSLS